MPIAAGAVQLAMGAAGGRRRVLAVPATARVGIAIGVAVGAAALAVVLRQPPLVAGAAALAAYAALAVRASRQRPLAGQAAQLAVASAILAVTHGGVRDAGDPQTMWRPVVAVLAYPLLARSAMRLLVECRRLREIDVLVAGALVGLAAGIVVQVLVGDWREAPPMSAWNDAQAALPSVLVGLDVAVLVVAGRAVAVRRARWGPLAPLLLTTVLLVATHLVQAVDITGEATATATLLAAAAIASLGLVALHPKAAAEPEVLAEEPPLFSTAHATVVVGALVAAPAVLAVQAIRQISVTATVATGAVCSGAVLAGYLVSLLQERAATEHRATHDALTRLPNRALFADRLERAIAHARRTERPVAVLFVDLDRFKEVNDTFGHAAGDLFLQEIARRLRTCCRDEDTVARLSGDEFAILLPHPDAGTDGIVVAQRVLDALVEPVTMAGERVLAACSIGIAVFPDDGSSTDELLASADAAMYRSKEQGGNGYELFNPQLATQAHERLRVESALVEGVERGELVLHYQPIVDLATGRTVGAEALVRWEHPERGLLLPGSFVPVAERSDLVVLLGEQVILDACRELRRWEDLGLHGYFVSVNVSARHFSHGLASTVAAALRETGADPAGLVIELTETTAADNLGVVAAALDDLHELGVRSAIDDFGTGYCGLRYLGTLTVDALKIDKSFVQGMTASDAAIVAATIAMGHSLGLTLVAEGVETEEQRRFLAAQGCDRIQGFLEGRPMSANALVDRIRAERTTHAKLLAVQRNLRGEVPAVS